MEEITPDTLAEWREDAVRGEVTADELADLLFVTPEVRAALAFGVPQSEWENCRQGIAAAILARYDVRRKP